MRLSGLSSALILSAYLPIAGSGQAPVVREGDGWVRNIKGTAAAQPKLRVVGHGPVTVEAGVAREFSYSVAVKVAARNELQARRLLDRALVHVTMEDGRLTIAAPAGLPLSTLRIQAPRLTSLEVTSTDGAVVATGVDGPVEINTRAGELSADRIRGECRLTTGGGEIRVGQVDGPLQCATGAGAINVKTVRADASLETNGGDIVANQVGGSVHASTGGGGIHIGSAGGTVNATSGGGEIIVDKAVGLVTAHNMAGPVQVYAAAGVQCESGTGGIRVSNISGTMRVSTAMGSIFANLLGSRLAESFLSTGNGDITVLIPSNLGVTVRAANDMADTMRRIIADDYPALRVRRRGTQLVAEGPVNGGGPVLQINATGGTIFIKRQ